MQIFSSATGDTTSSTYERHDVYDTQLVGNQGVRTVWFTHKKTDVGTCTLTFHDGTTDETLVSHTVSSGNPDAQATSVALPGKFYAKIASTVGDIVLDCYISD